MRHSMRSMVLVGALICACDASRPVSSADASTDAHAPDGNLDDAASCTPPGASLEELQQCGPAAAATGCCAAGAIPCISPDEFCAQGYMVDYNFCCRCDTWSGRWVEVVYDCFPQPPDAGTDTAPDVAVDAAGASTSGG